MYFERFRAYQAQLGLVVVLCLLIILTGCSNETKTKRVEPPSVVGTSETEETKYDTQILGVIKEINLSQQRIKLYATEHNEDIILNYSGGADITDEHGQIIAISQMNIGEMVDVFYKKGIEKLIKMKISDRAWEYKGVRNLTIDKTENVMEISEKNYKYTDELVIVDQSDLISLIDINSKDRLTVKGVGGKIYSIIVTKGHGYIRLDNYKDFIGGTIEVGYGIIIPVVENMLIVAGEGSYKVIMENGELVGTKSVTVARNQEITLDMGAYRIEKERVGTVDFIVSPEGADLYINGKLLDYSNPYQLNYGEHNIKATLSGYEDYLGELKIAEPYQTIYIDLAEATAEVDTNREDETTNNTTTVKTNEEENTDKATTNGTTKIDREHSIQVNSPIGFEIYLNGVYKGVAPCNFTKEIGNQILTISKEGYITKSYSVEILEDGKDVAFDFSDLVKTN